MRDLNGFDDEIPFKTFLEVLKTSKLYVTFAINIPSEYIKSLFEKKCQFIIFSFSVLFCPLVSHPSSPLSVYSSSIVVDNANNTFDRVRAERMNRYNAILHAKVVIKKRKMRIIENAL